MKTFAISKWGKVAVGIAALFQVQAFQLASLRAAEVELPAAAAVVVGKAGLHVTGVVLVADADVAVYRVSGTDANGKPVSLDLTAGGKVLGAGTEQPGASVSVDVSSRGDVDIVFDSDSDGLSDAREAALGTNPESADSDGDDFDDLIEVTRGGLPLNPEDTPELLDITANGRDGKHVVNVSIATVPGASFQLEQSSNDRGGWIAVGAPIAGDGAVHVVAIPAASLDQGRLIRVAVSK